MATDIEKAPEALQELVAKADTGARKPKGLIGKVIFGVALTWAVFQLWYASPLPFTFNFGILNDTEARSVHLAFALFLAFTAWPAFKSSPRDRVPWQDWIFAFAGAFAAASTTLAARTATGSASTRARGRRSCSAARRRTATAGSADTRDVSGSTWNGCASRKTNAVA